MSLERYKISKNVIHPMMGIAFVNFILVIILLVMAVTVMATPAGIHLQFPSKAQEIALAGAVMAVKITGENVIYFNDKVVTFNELRRNLAAVNLSKRTILIKAHRQASVGRVADILDLCRGIPGARVNVSTFD